MGFLRRQVREIAEAELAASAHKRALEEQAEYATRQVSLTIEGQKARDYAAGLTAKAAPDSGPEVRYGDAPGRRICRRTRT
jgi:hypothetical protein